MKRSIVVVTVVVTAAVLLGPASTLSAAPPAPTLNLNVTQNASDSCRLDIEATWTRYRPHTVSYQVIRRDVPNDVSVMTDFTDIAVARKQTSAPWSVTIDPTYASWTWSVYVLLYDRHDQIIANTFRGPLDLSSCT